MNIRKYYENCRAQRDLKQEINKLEREFSEWLKNKPFWKEFILNRMAESNTRDKYTYTREELFDLLLPKVRNIDVTESGMICFDVQIVDENMYQKTWVSTGYFNVLRLENIDNESPSPEDIEIRSKHKREKIDDYKREIEEYQERIKQEEKEISNLETWIKKEAED